MTTAPFAEYLDESLQRVAERLSVIAEQLGGRRTYFCRCGATMRRRRTLEPESNPFVSVCRGCRHRARQRRWREVDRLFLYGTGTGQPVGILNHGD